MENTEGQRTAAGLAMLISGVKRWLARLIPALTFGINLSHGGLRHKGWLCQREEALYRFKEWDKYSEKIWRKD